MPASWRICSLFPRDPESAIMKIGLKPSSLRRNPSMVSSSTSLRHAGPELDQLVVALVGREGLIAVGPVDLLHLAGWPSR